MNGTIGTLSPVRLNSAQLTLLPGDSNNSCPADNPPTRLLLWQQAAINANSMISLDGQMFWVEAVETLVLHFRRVQCLTLHALCGHALAAPGTMKSLNTGQGMA